MLLDIKDLQIHYDKVEVVKGICLQIEEGEIVALLGANGAGKTTILRTISGLKIPTSGEIWYRGQRIDGYKPSRIVQLGIGHVAEGRHIFRDMSVEDNLTLGAYIRKDKEGIKQDLEGIYTHFPRLKERSRQKAGSLSGGEQQMLAISMALLCKPKLMLMDEPSIGLSPLMKEEMTGIINIIHQQGISVLLVEQNAGLALRLATRGYVIETGRISLAGTREELISNDKVRECYLGA